MTSLDGHGCIGRVQHISHVILYIVVCVVELTLCGGEDVVFLSIDGVKQGLGFSVDGQQDYLRIQSLTPLST